MLAVVSPPPDGGADGEPPAPAQSGDPGPSEGPGPAAADTPIVTQTPAPVQTPLPGPTTTPVPAETSAAPVPTAGPEGEAAGRDLPQAAQIALGCTAVAATGAGAVAVLNPDLLRKLLNLLRRKP